MAFDGFIKLDGIAGESLDQRHKDWIEIVAYNFGIKQSTSAGDFDEELSAYGGDTGVCEEGRRCGEGCQVATCRNPYRDWIEQCLHLS